MAIDPGQILGGILGGGNVNQQIINAILATLTAVAGGQGTPFKQNTKTNNTTSTNTNSTSTSNPNLNPATLALLATAVPRLQQLSNPMDLASIGAYNAQRINENSDAQKQALQEEFASRGLANSPAAAAAEAGLEQNRINQITQMQEQLPLQQRQLQMQALQQASQLATSIPYGTSISTSGNQTQTQNGESDTSGSNGGGLGGILGGLAAVLAATSQQGRNNSGPPGSRNNNGGGTENTNPTSTSNPTNSQNNPITITIYDSSGKPTTTTVGGGGGTTPTGGNGGSGPTGSATSTVTYQGVNDNSGGGGSTTTLDPGNLYLPGTTIDPNVPVQNPPGYNGFGDPYSGGDIGGPGGVYGGTGGNGNPLDPNPGDGIPPGYGYGAGDYGGSGGGYIGYGGDQFNANSAPLTVGRNAAYNLMVARNPQQNQLNQQSNPILNNAAAILSRFNLPPNTQTSPTSYIPQPTGGGGNPTPLDNNYNPAAGGTGGHGPLVTPLPNSAPNPDIATLQALQKQVPDTSAAYGIIQSLINNPSSLNNEIGQNQLAGILDTAQKRLQAQANPTFTYLNPDGSRGTGLQSTIPVGATSVTNMAANLPGYMQMDPTAVQAAQNLLAARQRGY